jgi:hypothetical protein
MQFIEGRSRKQSILFLDLLDQFIKQDNEVSIIGGNNRILNDLRETYVPVILCGKFSAIFGNPLSQSVYHIDTIVIIESTKKKNNDQGKRDMLQ